MYFSIFVQCYQLNCVVWGPPSHRNVEFSVSVLKICRMSPLKQKVFVLVCVYQMYLVEHVIHLVHKKSVPCVANPITLYDALIILH